MEQSPEPARIMPLFDEDELADAVDSADPVCQKCTDPHGCPGRCDRGKHQGMGLDDAGAGGRGRRPDRRPRRVLAARQLGIAEIPVMVAAGWSEAQKRAYVLADAALVTKAYWRAVDSRLCSTCAGSEGDAAE